MKNYPVERNKPCKPKGLVRKLTLKCVCHSCQDFEARLLEGSNKYYSISTLIICDFTSAIVSVVFSCTTPSVNSTETSGGETTEVQRDGSLRTERARRGLSLAPASSPLRCLILLLICICSGGKTKPFAVWPAAQGVGAEFPLVLLVQRDLHTSVLQVLDVIPIYNKGPSKKP